MANACILGVILSKTYVSLLICQNLASILCYKLPLDNMLSCHYRHALRNTTADESHVHANSFFEHHLVVNTFEDLCSTNATDTPRCVTLKGHCSEQLHAGPHSSPTFCKAGPVADFFCFSASTMCPLFAKSWYSHQTYRSAIEGVS